MEDTIHQLTAGYALDALDPDERRAFEAHLAGCAECQEELASFWQATGSLARAAEGPAPPPALRGRLLERARAEPPNVVPLRPRRWAVPVATAAAAVAAVIAIGLGLWGLSVSRDLDRTRDVARVLSDPGARTIGLSGEKGRLVVGSGGDAVLVTSDLPAAPDGRTYQIWVIEDGKPASAGLFDDESVVELDRTAPDGSTVAVTVEKSGGAEQPTSTPIFSAQV
jgi:anti-sigma-K factor RskA